MIPSLAELGEGPIARLTSRDGHVLELTGMDALWMARACVGEGQGDTIAVTSTMLRRWAFLADHGGPQFASLTALVVGTEAAPRGYSQPVSVYWRTRGPESRQARRLRIRSLEWEDIDRSVRASVLGLFGGELGLSMRGAVHFADGNVSRARMREEPSRWILVGRGRNWFLAVPGSRSYPDPVREALIPLGGGVGPFPPESSSGPRC